MFLPVLQRIMSVKFNLGSDSVMDKPTGKCPPPEQPSHQFLTLILKSSERIVCAAKCPAICTVVPKGDQNQEVGLAPANKATRTSRALRERKITNPEDEGPWKKELGIVDHHTLHTY